MKFMKNVKSNKENADIQLTVMHNVTPLSPPTHTPFCWGVKPSTKCSKRRGLTGSQILGEGRVAGKEGVTFFSGSRSFYKELTKTVLTVLQLTVLTMN